MIDKTKTPPLPVTPTQYKIYFAATFVVFLAVGYFRNEYDEDYWFNAFTGPLSIATLLVLLVWFCEKFKTVEKIPWILFYPALFVFSLCVFFWYLDDYRQEYWSNVFKQALNVTAAVFLLGRFAWLTERWENWREKRNRDKGII
jgi:hypothetical protein